MEMDFYNKHYVSVDEQNRIVSGFSDAFRQPTDTDICINEQGGYQFRLFLGGEENPSLLDWNGMIPLYAYVDGKVVKRTEEEIEADRSALPVPETKPTNEERITLLEAQLAESDEVAISLYEAQAAQEAVNAEQDDAILELYELVGG